MWCCWVKLSPRDLCSCTWRISPVSECSWTLSEESWPRSEKNESLESSLEEPHSRTWSLCSSPAPPLSCVWWRRLGQELLDWEEESHFLMLNCGTQLTATIMDLSNIFSENHVKTHLSKHGHIIIIVSDPGDLGLSDVVRSVRVRLLCIGVSSFTGWGSERSWGRMKLRHQLRVSSLLHEHCLYK